MSDVLQRLKTALADRYKIEEELGAGGMALVYLAEDLKLGRKVAVKVLRPELAAVVGHERFLQEISITANLQHPNILPLYESGMAAGFVYYVTPYVEGQTLRDKIYREKQLGLDDTIRITHGVADALQYAHDQHVIHRDIKPENILLQQDIPLVADFGIALAVDRAGKDRMTGTGLSVGTLDYISPEQATGERDLSGRADIFSLACVVYEMLAGEPPYVDSSAQATIARRLVGPPPRVSDVRNGITTVVEEALVRALAPDPLDRFASVREFMNALSSTPLGQVAGAVDQNAGSEPARPDRHSIVVLPFANLSSDPETDFFSDGITEELIHRLARITELRVVARTSAFAFKNKQEDVRRIGEALNVNMILEGSVRRVKAKVRITAQLVNAEDGYELWSERYDREVEDVFEVQDELASAIAATAKITLLGESPTGPKAPTDDVTAHEAYLKGRFHWNKRTEAGVKKSIEFFEEALTHDSDFALAAAALADAYIILGVYGTEPPTEVMPQAKEAATEALRLDATLAEPSASLACIEAVYDWNWDAAERGFLRAIDINPNYPTAYQWYAVNCLTPQRRFEEARHALDSALKLDPVSPVMIVSKGLVWYCEREFDRAVEQYTAALDIDSNFGMAHYFLSQALEHQGQPDKALEALERAVALAGETPEILASVAHGHAVAGNQAKAETLIDTLIAWSEERFVSPALVALVYTGIGSLDTALEWLERAHRAHSPELIWLRTRPTFDPLRGEAQFEELCRRIGLAEKPGPS